MCAFESHCLIDYKEKTDQYGSKRINDRCNFLNHISFRQYTPGVPLCTVHCFSIILSTKEILGHVNYRIN